MSGSLGSPVDRVRAAWPPSDSGSGPATGRDDLTGTALLDVLPLGDPGDPQAAVALAEFPKSSRVQAVPLVAHGDGWRRADPGDGVSALLVSRLGKTDDTASARAIRLRSWGADTAYGHGERAVPDDQTNESVIVGESVIVKWLRPVPETTSRALTLTSHLAAVGFSGIPRPLGALVWRAPSGTEVALAHLDEFLPGAEDGYTWCVDALLEHLESCSPECAPDPRGCRAWFAAELGALTGGLHAALATSSDVLPDPIAQVSARGLADRADTALDDALEATSGGATAWLHAYVDRLRWTFRTLPDDGPVVTGPVHGDLHVGQVLRWDGGLAVIDFDGNPTLEEHPLSEPPARDVAQMTCSIDHVGRIADRRTEHRHLDRVEEWIHRSRSRFLGQYTSALANRGLSALFDERLLHGFEAEQECRELVYAARFLPRWTYAPLGALTSRFGGH